MSTDATKLNANANPAIVPVEGPVHNRDGDAYGNGSPSSGGGRSSATPLRRQQQRQERQPGQPSGGDGTASAYGANNEELPERLREALRRLVFQFSTESEPSRRAEIRRIKQAHQFWRGLQYSWWDERDQNWHLPFEQKLGGNSAVEDMPRYEFVTNIYQAFGLSLVSVLSQDVPRVRFFPSSAQAEEDVAAAKAATEVAGLVERNNRIGNLIVEEAFNLWTDGKVGAYVRFVVDGQRFGFHPETEIGMREVKVGSDVYVCPECGAEMRALATETQSHGEGRADGGGADGKNTGGVRGGERQGLTAETQSHGEGRADGGGEIPRSARDDKIADSSSICSSVRAMSGWSESYAGPPGTVQRDAGCASSSGFLRNTRKCDMFCRINGGLR